MSPVTMEPIGIIRSPFGEKFTTPRQPGLVKAAEGFLELNPPFDRIEAFKGIEQYSHLWLLFLFHLTPTGEWQPTVRPPRLGGNQRVGVFASRSPFRPNRLGLSAVVNLGLEEREGRLGLVLGGVDLVDGTPILDIKPYLPYTDSIPAATAGEFQRAPAAPRSVQFADRATERLKSLGAEGERLRRLLEQTLALDPRPGYRQREETGEFGALLGGMNVRWSEAGREITVTEITPQKTAGCRSRG